MTTEETAGPGCGLCKWGWKHTGTNEKELVLVEQCDGCRATPVVLSPGECNCRELGVDKILPHEPSGECPFHKAPKSVRRAGMVEGGL